MPELPYALGVRWAPLVATCAVIVTLVACVSIAKVENKYLGGLTWPYFSDVGRESPGYAIFCAGLSIVAISLVLTWSANYQFQRQVVDKEAPNDTDGRYAASIHKYIKIVRALGVLSAIGLPVLAFFSTTAYPDVHQYAAYWFFLLEAFALLLNTVASFKLSCLMKMHHGRPDYVSDTDASGSTGVLNPWSVSTSSTRRTFYLQVVCAGLFFVAFLLYLPIGLAIMEPFERLTVLECQERDLGEEYCTVTMRLNETETKLWNYERDLTANQMRSASQLVCILTLVGYSLTFLSHDSDALQNGD